MNVLRAEVEAHLRLTSSTPAQTAVGTTAGQVLAATSARRGLIIQNTGTTILYVVLGASTPTASVYHVALAACTGANDGKGGIYIDDAWIGAVQMIGSAAGGTCVITEVS